MVTQSGYTLSYLTEISGGELVGDGNIIITGVAPLNSAKKGEISFLSHKKDKELAKNCQASALIVPYEIEDLPQNLIKSGNPRLSFAKIMQIFAPKKKIEKGVHPTAIISEEVNLGEDVSIGAYAFIGKGVKIGKNTIIYPHTFIGEKVQIGEDCLIYPQVVIMDRITIGNRVIIHAGCVLGADGFGFAQDEKRKSHKIPQIGTVEIQDDVEIGANCCIDRATLGKTIILRGCKFDNLVQVGHNVVLGEDCLIVAQVGIAGSCTIGDRVILAGQAGVSDHINIGSDTIIGGQAGVTKDVPSHSIYSGYPAAPHSEQKRLQTLLKQLPDLAEKIRKIEEMLKK